MGIVRSVSREYATELSCCIVKRVVGVVAQTRPPKFTRINQVLVTHEAKRARHRRRSRMGNGTRFHGIPLRIRPVIGSNARILKIRNSSLLEHRPIISRDFLIFALLRINGGGESC